MNTTHWILLALAVLLVLGYLFALRVLLHQSRAADQQVDRTKLRPWQDEEGKG
jgi:hypothetical protein